MDNDIKEILAYMMQYVENKYEHDSEPMLNYKDIKCVLDYITNLQEENTELKKLADKYEEEHNNEFQCWKKDRKELLDRKAKMEKAVEIAKRLQRDYGYMLEDLIFLLSTGGDE